MITNKINYWKKDKFVILKLKEELKYGSWVVADMDLNYLFRNGQKDLWNQVMKHKGDVFSVLAEVPEQITWN